MTDLPRPSSQKRQMYLGDGPVDALGHALLEQGLGNVALRVDDGAHKIVVVARLQHHLNVTLQQ